MDDRSVEEDGTSSEDALSATGDEADIVTVAGDKINLKMLKSMLKSFGSLRSFSLAKDIDSNKAGASLFVTYVSRLTRVWIVPTLCKGFSCGVLRPSPSQCCLCCFAWPGSVRHEAAGFRTRPLRPTRA